MVAATISRPLCNGDQAPDRDGYRNRNPTPQEVIDNTRVCTNDGALSLWQIRAYGLSLIVVGGVLRDGTVRWHLLVPFEAEGKPEGTAARGFRLVDVFPPPDEDAVHLWAFRPLDAANHKPVTWESLAENASFGRDLYAETLREHAEWLANREPPQRP